MLRNKKGILLGVLLLGVILLGGCQTVSGVVGGTAKGLAYALADTASGAATDTYNIWRAVVKADDWIKKNLW